MGAPEIRISDTVSENAVGPILRAGEIAEAAIGAIAEDNPDKEVSVVDRGDYVRVHTDGCCRLTKATLEKHLGREYDLAMIEIEMPSFSGRLRTRWNEYVWYYEKA
jgi:toluene monooxygenase system protein D